MPYELDEMDIAIIKSLIKDGRKSLRQISRELKISTPTVNFRFQRLLNIGLIKSISPIIDTSKLDTLSKNQLQKCQCLTDAPDVNLTSDTIVKMSCDLCEAVISNKPQVLKFANIERFFCCNSCKTLYKEKHRGRIESIIENFQEKIKNNALKSVVLTASLFSVTTICIDHGLQHTMHSFPNLI
jgi:DNA-binding Lrp family transcriptional regulator